MKKEKVILFLLLAFLLSACSSSSSETPFSENGISFTCPKGWKIDETDYMDGSYYVCAEKAGYNDSGLFIVMAFDEKTDAREYMESYEEALVSQDVWDELTFGTPAAGTYGPYSGLSVKYSGSVMNVPHQGKMTIFDVGNRTVCVTVQEALEDQKKNKEGFETLERTFTVTTLDDLGIDGEDDFFPIEDDEIEEIEELEPAEIEE